MFSRTDTYVDAVAEIDRSLLRSLSPLSRIRAELTIISWLRRAAGSTPSFARSPRTGSASGRSSPGRNTGWVKREAGCPSSSTRKVAVTKGEKGVLRYYCELATAAGAQVRSYQTSFVVPAEAKEWARTLLRSWNLGNGERFVVLHPGASAHVEGLAPRTVCRPHRPSREQKGGCLLYSAGAGLISRLSTQSGNTLLPNCGWRWTRVMCRVLRHSSSNVPCAYQTIPVRGTSLSPSAQPRLQSSRDSKRVEWGDLRG